LTLTVGTFNLNNLFSRWNFTGAVDEMAEGAPAGALTLRYEFTDPDTYRLRTFRGRLVEQKEPRDTLRLAERIRRLDLDVLAVQEVENVDTLRQFNTDQLASLYPHVALIEGNDVRFIDVAILSKAPLGAITSHQTWIHPDRPGERVFSRDLLEVELFDARRRRRLLTLYVTHLKSKFVAWPTDPVVGARENDALRLRQAESTAAIVARRQRTDARYVILGDMNDVAGASTLAPLVEIEGRRLVDGLASPVETRPPPNDRSGPGPEDARWTYRFKPSGEPARYQLLDQIWLSEALGDRLVGAGIDRRIRLTGDGSDHDPAWVELDV
jgi:predicted extracellular nuclease